MRPRLRVVPDELVTPILDEAKRILAEIGIEVRGAIAVVERDRLGGALDGALDKVRRK